MDLKRKSILNNSIFLILLLLLLFLITSINIYGFDFGCGGYFVGFGLRNNLNFIDLFSSNTNPFVYQGFYGYGIKEKYILGGFTVLIFGNEFGGIIFGLISGIKILKTFVFDLDLLWWLGIGPVITDIEYFEYFGFFNEFTLEFGFKLVKWEEIFFFSGFQYVGNLSPEPLLDFYNYSITFGIRIAFGS